MSNLTIWLRDRLDDQQQRNGVTGLVAWLTYRDGNGKLLDTQLAAEGWTVTGLAAVRGWTHVNVVHNERIVRIEIAAKRAILNLHEHHRDHVVTHAPNQYITDVLATALGYGGVALLGVRLIPSKEPDPSLASA